MDPFLGEIRPFACTYAPDGWMLCNGQILRTSEYSALFSVIKDKYGGDGRTTFALPNLQQRAPIGAGQGPNLSDYPLGAAVGQATATISTEQMPAHSHTLHAGAATSEDQVKAAPGPNVQLGRVFHNRLLAPGYATNLTQPTKLGLGTIDTVGRNMPHENRQPTLAINFCIAWKGVFPSRGG